jgi:hypothetical protein
LEEAFAPAQAQTATAAVGASRILTAIPLNVPASLAKWPELK